MSTIDVDVYSESDEEDDEDTITTNGGDFGEVDESSCDQFRVEDADFSPSPVRDESDEIHHLLDHDMNVTNAIMFPKFEQLTQRKAVDLENTMKGTHEIVLSIPLGIICDRLRELWCLDMGSHMIIRISPVSPLLYMNAECPMVRASILNSSSTKCAATQAIEVAMKLFFEDKWNRPPKENLLERALQFAIDRLIQLGNFCMQCGSLQLGAHPLLSVCDRDLCVFQRDYYRELETVGSTLGPRLWADSAELIAFLFRKAWQSSRKAFVCHPYPVKAEGMFPTEQSVDAICRTLSEWCPRCVFSDWASWEKFRKEEATIPAASFLYWLSDHMPVTVRLPPRYRVVNLATEQQYLLPPVPSPRETRFETAKSRAGGKTRFLFHGSPVENWYRIMSDGLLVLSGTDNQLYGAAYGNGIYMADNPATSANYSLSRRVSNVNDQSKASTMCPVAEHALRTHINNGTWCLALCEVVDDTSKFLHYGNPYYVLSDPECVQVRMLFIYPTRDSVPSMMVPQQEHYTSVRTAMEFYRSGPYFERLLAVFDSDKDPNPSTADHSFIPPFPAPYS